MTGASYWSRLDRHTDWDGFWMSHPAARARINRRVTGDPARWPIAWLASVVPDRVPFRRALSVGCGVGNFERTLVELELAGEITGIDASAEAIGRARESAARTGMEARIRYVAGDARAFLRGERELDAVFFHESLHHFDRLPELLDLVRRALQPRGVLYLDEYVGPAREEWTWRHWLAWNGTYRTLPRRMRRTRIVRPPVSAEDPSEAIESSGILPAVGERFHVIVRRDYGGNLLEPIYPSLRRPNQPGGPEPAVFDRAVERLLDREERLLARGEASFHAVVVAEPKAVSGG